MIIALMLIFSIDNIRKDDQSTLFKFFPFCEDMPIRRTVIRIFIHLSHWHFNDNILLKFEKFHADKKVLSTQVS